MAKNSMRARENKRLKLTNKFREKRSRLKEIIRVSNSLEEKLDAQVKLQKLPRDSNKTRITRRCSQCGRPRAVYQKFSLCRLCLRKYLMRGDVPGGKKASW